MSFGRRLPREIAGRCGWRNCATVGDAPGSALLSGCDVHPGQPDLVYYSEDGISNIAELDTRSSTVRHWNIAVVGANRPENLVIARPGEVWVTAASGHLVRLEVNRNAMTASF